MQVPLEEWKGIAPTRLLSRQAEKDPGYTSQFHASDNPSLVNWGKRGDARPFTRDNTFQHHGAFPPPSSRTGVRAEAQHPKIDPARGVRPLQTWEQKHGNRWDCEEREADSGEEQRISTRNPRLVLAGASRKSYQIGQVDYRANRRQLPAIPRMPPEVEQGRARSRAVYPTCLGDGFHVHPSRQRQRHIVRSSGDQLGWSSISEVDSSEDDTIIETRPRSQIKGGTVASQSLSIKDRRDMKLERFDGTVRVESFLAKFKICSRHNRWNEADRMDNLQCALTGEAAQILWDMGADGVKTSKDLIRQLQARYGSANQTALYRTQLKFRRRQRGETLAELVNDVRRLIVLAYPGPSSPMKEAFACEAFLEALNDEDLALKIREKEPPTLEEAYQFAMRLEAYAVVHEPDKNDRKVFLSRKVAEGQTRPETDPEKFLETLRNMSELQQASFEKLFGEIRTIVERHNAPLSNKRSRNKRRLGQRNGNKEPRRRFGNKKCFQCREVVILSPNVRI